MIAAWCSSSKEISRAIVQRLRRIAENQGAIATRAREIRLEKKAGSNSTLAVFVCGFLRFGEGLLRGFVSLVRVLHGLPRMFVAAHMVFLVVMGCCSAMRMGCHFVKFGCATVVSVGHDSLLQP